MRNFPDMKKFMKDLVIKKQTVHFELADNIHHCSAIASRSLVKRKRIMELSLFLVLLSL